MIPRPDASEHHPYYSAYTSLVPEGDVIETLRTGIGTTTALLRGASPAQADHRYAPGKWSLKEVVAHLADTERTFAFRAFWFARHGPGDLASFDQDAFVQQGFVEQRSLESLVDEFEAVRASSVALFGSLTPEALARTGVASGYMFSVRAFAFIAAGHEIHHRKQLVSLYGL